jgi:hypothetical protein
MDQNEAYQAAWSMREVGGDFIKTLAACWFAADDENRQALQNAFQGYFTRYFEIHQFRSRVYG